MSKSESQFSKLKGIVPLNTITIEFKLELYPVKASALVSSAYTTSISVKGFYLQILPQLQFSIFFYLQ